MFFNSLIIIFYFLVQLAKEHVFFLLFLVLYGGNFIVKKNQHLSELLCKDRSLSRSMIYFVI